MVELINKKDFNKAALDKNSDTFVIYVTFFNLALISIYLDREAQKAFLHNKKIKILDKYSNFIDVFSKKKTLVLLEQTELNEHAINLKDSK